MRNCEQCGGAIPEGDLFCPVCGQEVQLVPNYETMESQFQVHEKLLEQEERIRAEERMAREKAARERKERLVRRGLIIGIAAVAALAVLIIVLVFRGQGTHTSFESQYAAAEDAYRDGNLNESLRYTAEALKIRPRDADAKFLMAKIYRDMGRSDEAIETLLELLEEHPDHADGTELLISLYEERGDGPAIQAILKKSNSEELKRKYADYLPQPPVFSLPGGTYNGEETVSLSLVSGEGRIYYTLDGSTPSENSFVYTDPIPLGEGSTTICAYAVMKNKTVSDVVRETYKIEWDVADAPVISPASGRYTQKVKKDASGADEEREETKKITVAVPSGYTCYYAFDKRPTETSAVYKDPIDMPLGEHIFYAVLMDKEGKLGKVGSATYVYREIVTTPTPTPTPRPTLTPTGAPTPTATPTPTPTPKPTPVLVSGITLSETMLYMGLNESKQLTATVFPENASNKNLKWTSDSNLIIVGENSGMVTTLGVGDATITATATDGSGVYATCQVSVGYG